MPTQPRHRITTTPTRARRGAIRTRSRAKTVTTVNPSKLEVAMGRGVRQVKRTAGKVARATGAMITTAKKRVKRAAARQRLKQKVRKAGAALKEVGKAAMMAGLAAGAVRSAQIITRRS